MAVLPDELWRRILEIGIKTSNFSFKELCCLSITCRSLNRLSSEDFNWASLLSSDFPDSFNHVSFLPANSSSNIVSSQKTLYKIRYERDKERKLLAHRRKVLRIESEITERLRKVGKMELQLSEEREKIKSTIAEVSNLHKVRQASVALKVWQPEVIRGRQKQIVEQCDVPVDIRINGLEMELQICKKQIEGLEKAIRLENKRLDTAKEQLASIKYHPLQDFNLSGKKSEERDVRMKRLKHSHTVKEQS